jgi:recombination protein RecA
MLHERRKEITLTRDDVFKSFGREFPFAADKMVDVVGAKFAQDRKVASAIALKSRIPRLDMALYGGFAPGVAEIFGPESSGKTALLGALLAAAQQQGKETALCATEDRDVEYWAALGVDTDDLLFIEAEDSNDLADMLVDFVSGDNRVLGLDSITALRSLSDGDSPSTNYEHYMDWLGVVTDILDDVNNKAPPSSVMVLTSQVRARKSANHAKAFAGGTETASRRIVDRFSVRLELSRDHVSETEYTMVLNIISNILGPPAKFINLPAIKGRGVNHRLDALRVAAELNLIEKKGPWYRLPSGVYHGESAAAEAVELDELRDMLDSWYASQR